MSDNRTRSADLRHSCAVTLALITTLVASSALAAEPIVGRASVSRPAGAEAIYPR